MRSPDSPNENAPQAGDILLFKIPPYKPFLGDRFIRFMQLFRGADSKYAGTVHAAIVLRGKPLMISHFTNSGHSIEDLTSTHYKQHPYEIYRPTGKRAEYRRTKMVEMANSLIINKRPTFVEPEPERRTSYSVRKMILAFLRNETIKLPPKLQERLVARLNNKSLQEEICSTFVAKVIKNADPRPKNDMAITSSYLLPYQLNKLLDRDVNFRKIQQPLLTDEQKYDHLLQIAKSVVTNMNLRAHSPLLFNRAQYHSKYNLVSRAMDKLQKREKSPHLLLSTLLPLLDVRTGPGIKQPESVTLLLAEAKRLNIDTKPYEAQLKQREESETLLQRLKR